MDEEARRRHRTAFALGLQMLQIATACCMGLARQPGPCHQSGVLPCGHGCPASFRDVTSLLSWHVVEASTRGGHKIRFRWNVQPNFSFPSLSLTSLQGSTQPRHIPGIKIGSFLYFKGNTSGTGPWSLAPTTSRQLSKRGDMRMT